MDIVTKHLRRWAATDFVWGETDCSLVLADYVLDATGIDGAAHLRGRYTDRESCIALTGLDRGLEHVVGDCAARATLAPTSKPQRGDIGVLRIRHLEFAGVFLGDKWAVKSADGVLFPRNPTVVASWSVPL